MYENSNELYHYGVLGMKWGVHRYKNKYGPGLTKRGEKKFASVEKSKYASKSHTNTAKWLLSEQAKASQKSYDKYDAKFNKLNAKANKILEKERRAEAAGNDKKAYTLNQKRKRVFFDMDDANTARYIEKQAVKMATKKLKDIESGKMKAGRDFIVQKDWDFGLGTMDYTLVERNSYSNNGEYRVTRTQYGTTINTSRKR